MTTFTSFHVLLVTVLVMSLPAIGSERYYSSSLGWKTQEKFVTVKLNDTQPELDIWQVGSDKEVALINSVELAADTFQGYGTAIIANSSDNQPSEYIVVFGRDGIYQLIDAKPSLLIKTQSIHSHLLDTDVFKPLPYALDVNQDGLTDFLLPDLSQQVLWLQSTSGTFTAHKLSVNLASSLYEDEKLRHRFTLSLPISTQVADITGDGLNDIVIAFEQAIHVFAQSKVGTFTTESNLLSTPFPLDSNMQKVQQSGRNQAYFLQQVADINSDGLLDLVVEKKIIEQDKSESQAIELYLGKLSPKGSSDYHFTRSGSLIVDGEMLSYGLADFSGDGNQEFYYVAGDIGASSVMSAFFGSGFEVDVVVHQQLDQGALSKKPLKSLSTSFKLDVKNAVFGLVIKTIDVNGDGIKDIVLEHGNNRLIAHYGSKSKPLKSRSNKKKVTLPAHPNRLQTITVKGLEYLVSLEQVESFPKLNKLFF